MRVLVAGAVALALGLAPHAAAAQNGLVWERWKTVAGVFDVGGPTAHGALVVAGAGTLFLLSPSGELVPFASGPRGYHDDAGSEAYIAVSTGGRDAAANCSFAPDDIYALRLHKPLGVTRIASSGLSVTNFANLPNGVTALHGIAFDSTGAFGHRLLVSAPVSGHEELYGIDCNGVVTPIVGAGPAVEGGYAVAPMTFGAFAGQLIAANELTGVIWAFDAAGGTHKVANAGLPIGGDTGVESLGFVPPGFEAGGYLYYADRLTAGNAHPGTDSLLRLSSQDLVSVGVRAGDLLVAAEGGAPLIDVRCSTTCQVTHIVTQPTTAHGEGHLAMTITAQPASAASPAPQPASQIPAPLPAAATGASPEAIRFAAGVVLVLMLIVAAALVARSRRRPEL